MMDPPRRSKIGILFTTVAPMHNSLLLSRARRSTGLIVNGWMDAIGFRSWHLLVLEWTERVQYHGDGRRMALGNLELAFEGTHVE